MTDKDGRTMEEGGENESVGERDASFTSRLSSRSGRLGGREKRGETTRQKRAQSRGVGGRMALVWMLPLFSDIDPSITDRC